MNSHGRGSDFFGGWDKKRQRMKKEGNQKSLCKNYVGQPFSKSFQSVRSVLLQLHKYEYFCLRETFQVLNLDKGIFSHCEGTRLLPCSGCQDQKNTFLEVVDSEQRKVSRGYVLSKYVEISSEELFQRHISQTYRCLITFEMNLFTKLIACGVLFF